MLAWTYSQWLPYFAASQRWLHGCGAHWAYGGKLTEAESSRRYGPVTAGFRSVVSLAREVLFALYHVVTCYIIYIMVSSSAGEALPQIASGQRNWAGATKRSNR
jgi:hypothetical protein